MSEEELSDAEGPMDTEEPMEDFDRPDTQEEEGADLKKMADDYAKYLIVNSKQDVSFKYVGRVMTRSAGPLV
jgi:hypothetical protein